MVGARAVKEQAPLLLLPPPLLPACLPLASTQQPSGGRAKQARPHARQLHSRLPLWGMHAFICWELAPTSPRVDTGHLSSIFCRIVTTYSLGSTWSCGAVASRCRKRILYPVVVCCERCTSERRELEKQARAPPKPSLGLCGAAHPSCHIVGHPALPPQELPRPAAIPATKRSPALLCSAMHARERPHQHSDVLAQFDVLQWRQQSPG